MSIKAGKSYFIHKKSWLVTHRDGIPALRRSTIPVLTEIYTK